MYYDCITYVVYVDNDNEASRWVRRRRFFKAATWAEVRALNALARRSYNIQLPETLEKEKERKSVSKCLLESTTLLTALRTRRLFAQDRGRACHLIEFATFRGADFFSPISSFCCLFLSLFLFFLLHFRFDWRNMTKRLRATSMREPYPFINAWKLNIE